MNKTIPRMTFSIALLSFAFSAELPARLAVAQDRVCRTIVKDKCQIRFRDLFARFRGQDSKTPCVCKECRSPETLCEKVLSNLSQKIDRYRKWYFDELQRYAVAEVAGDSKEELALIDKHIEEYKSWLDEAWKNYMVICDVCPDCTPVDPPKSNDAKKTEPRGQP